MSQPSHATAGALDLATVRARMAVHDGGPHVDTARPGIWQAATALVVAPGDAHLEVALIRRAERDGDRWSGHMALPGGRRSPVDPDLAATAARETLEEVGLRLGPPAGRLADHRRQREPMTVATFVHTLEARAALHPDPTEVAVASWVPLPLLLDPAAVAHRRVRGRDVVGVEVPDGIVWGLTLGLLQRFAAAVGLEPES